jgi:hypothetical protein
MNKVQVHEFMWSSYGVQYVQEHNLVASQVGTGRHPGFKLSLDAVSFLLWHTGSTDIDSLLKGSDSQTNLGSYYHSGAAAPMPLIFSYDPSHAAELKSLYETCEDVPDVAFSNSLLNASQTYGCESFARQCMDPLPGKTWGKVKAYEDPTTGAAYNYTQDRGIGDNAGVEVTCGCCRCKHLHGGGCTDTAGWVDSQGDGCSSYEATCEYSDTYQVDGVGANQACCVCGGGTQPVCNA